MNYHRHHRSPRKGSFLSLVTFLSVIALLMLASEPPANLSSTSLSLATNRNSADRLLVFHVTKFNGFGAQYLRLIDAAALAAEMGRRLCFHRVKYWNYGCEAFRGWNCYFEGLQCETPPDCPEFESLTLQEIGKANCIKISTDKSSRAASRVLREMGEGGYERASELGRGMWKVNEKTRCRIGKLRDELMKRLGSEYVGVHVRRGDKEREVSEVALGEYVEAVRLLSRRSAPVFLASDDGSVVQELSRELRERRVVALASLQGRRGHTQGGWNKKWRGKYDDVIELLVEIEMLANATVFVGTFSSNLGRLVYVMRGGKKRDTGISLDDRWETGVAWKTFGKPYCGGKGVNHFFCGEDEEDEEEVSG